MDSTGWEVWANSQMNPVAVTTACTCACDTVVIQSPPGTSQSTAMTLYTLDQGSLVNSRRTYTSYNGKRLFYDGAKWRVADATSATSGGAVESAATTAYCPTAVDVVWHAADAGGVFSFGGVSVSCDCECNTLNVQSSSTHTLGSEKGAVTYERVLGMTGEGQRPLYQGYSGQVRYTHMHTYIMPPSLSLPLLASFLLALPCSLAHAAQYIMWDAGTNAWYTSSTSATEPSDTGLRTVKGALEGSSFCPIHIPSAHWETSSGVAETFTGPPLTCTCQCQYIEIDSPHGASAGYYQQLAAASNPVGYTGAAPVFEQITTGTKKYLFYLKAELRWIVSESAASPTATMSIRSDLTASFCPSEGSVSTWFATTGTSTWDQGTQTRVMCSPFGTAPPPPPPPAPPYAQMCTCSEYSISSPDYSGVNSGFFNSEYQLVTPDPGSPFNGGKPVLARLWSR